MSEKLVIGPFNRGLRNDRPPFMIDNESFPTLINAYQWRGRIKRKRGTTLLGRLKRQIEVAQNLIGQSLTLSPIPVSPGSVDLVGSIDGTTYTDPAGDGILIATGGTGTGGTINYRTGVITIDVSIPPNAGQLMTGTYDYYPLLPVMGLEDFKIDNSPNIRTIGFDTKYSYNIDVFDPYDIYDVTFYKNPPTGTYAGYVAKGTPTPFTWNGQDYQQVYTTNYQGAMWTTYGITVPFTITNIGMQYKPIVEVTVIDAGPPAKANLEITNHGLVIGDFVFINEVMTTTGINYQTGYVVTVVDANNVEVVFPNAVIATEGTGGIAQYLTNTSDPLKDCLRWYDGDPTFSNAALGWVNFCPPLSNNDFIIDDLPSGKYYLVGARIVKQFKDRLLFFGPVVQTSSTGSQVYLQDAIVYSQVGTPYYTASFDGTAVDALTSPETTYFPILVPLNQTATANAYFEDTTGFGGSVVVGVDQAINGQESNEDVLIIGLDTSESRLVYTGNDILPFNFFQVSSELGTSSIFSVISMDQGVLSKGSRGFIITNQSNAQRIDLEIPDKVFEMKTINNGNERVTAIRDFINEWVYFTYPDDSSTYNFPTQTLMYNYRDNSWAIFNESYTTYGTFRRATGLSWLKIPFTWNTWNESWNSGESNTLQPKIIAGNAQGFVMIKDTDTTQEAPSLQIGNISGNSISSPNHCLNNGDFIYITGCLGTIGAQVNGKIFQIHNAATNTFVLSASIPSGTYEGGGLITRLYRPTIRTKQFPTAWELSRKTRLGVQQYLLSKTDRSQITVLIYLSQNDTVAFNQSTIVPDPTSVNNGLIYSTIVYTCPESTNLGLLPASITPARSNLQQLNIVVDANTAANAQDYIWHRVNTSLLGDTVQLGFTLSDEQMRELDDDGNFINQFSEIEVAGIILDVSPSGMLS